ncbi:AAA-like domain-containing protein [Coleofasciculus sp. E2-BRE-01]|uniref:AAA-like domain-containing protein n=1 Tax=Coleofasciculus sp. E2-BRE-01 TaxID=3069524 RepID=UPI0032F385D3
MDVEEALILIDQSLQPEGLTDTQELIFRQCWQGKSYYDIAQEFDYDAGYLRIAGSQLWQQLSRAFGEKTTKANLQSVLRRRMNATAPSFILNPSSTQPDYPGSPVSCQSPFYIQRPPIELECCTELVQPGALLRIKAPERMGKTSLLGYLLNFAKNQGYNTICLSFQQADNVAMNDLNSFLRWFCKSISWRLELAPKLEEYWDMEPGLAKSNCTRYFEKYILPQFNAPLVMVLDDLEQIFVYPQIAQEFLPLLRVWHEYANESEIWESLRIVVAHSTEVYVPMRVNQSPFNVGFPMSLSEFDAQQIQALAQAYGLNLADTEIEQLMAMVGGYPYLVQLALYTLDHDNITLAQLLQEALTASGIYNGHLRRLASLITTPQLADAVRQVMGADETVLSDSCLAYKLNSLGLIKLQENKATPSCELYRQYFGAWRGSS